VVKRQGADEPAVTAKLGTAAGLLSEQLLDPAAPARNCLDSTPLTAIPAARFDNMIDLSVPLAMAHHAC
jgi:hypothetical protein